LSDDTGSDDTGGNTGLPEVPNLVFQTGFEPDTEHVYTEDTEAPCTDDLWGQDNSVSDKGHWEDDLEGGAFGVGHFCFGGGDRTQRQVNLVADPDDSTNQVLQMWIAEPAENVSDDDDEACNGETTGARKARIQHTLQENPDVRQLDYRTRIRLGDAYQAMVDASFEITWMTIGEFWNNNSADPYSFRVTLNLVKEAKAGAPLVFGLKSDTQADGVSSWEEVWEHVSDVTVPIGEWFTLEVSMTEGDESTGRAQVHVTTLDGTRHEVADISNWTHHPEDPAPDGFTDINTLKVYTSGVLMCTLQEMGMELEAWWDDYAIGASAAR
jgi:hypothetical protein